MEGASKRKQECVCVPVRDRSHAHADNMPDATQNVAQRKHNGFLDVSKMNGKEHTKHATLFIIMLLLGLFIQKCSWRMEYKSVLLGIGRFVSFARSIVFVQRHVIVDCARAINDLRVSAILEIRICNHVFCWFE